MSGPARSTWAVASMLLTLAAASMLVSRGSRAAGPRRDARGALRRRSSPTPADLVYRWDPADLAPAARTPARLVRLHVPDLRQLGLDPAVAVRQQSRDPGGHRRRRHDRRPEGRPRAVARPLDRAGLRHGAEPAVGPAAALDGQLPRVPHRRDRRRGLPRRRHQDLRRSVARRGAQDADERAVAIGAAGPAGRSRARRRRQPDPDQSPSRQDRFADARAGPRRLPRRTSSCTCARTARCPRSPTSAAATPRRRRSGTRRRRCRRAAGTPTAAFTAAFR